MKKRVVTEAEASDGGTLPSMMRSVDVSSESFAALDGVSRLGEASALAGVILAVGCGAQAQMKGIWWMPWH